MVDSTVISFKNQKQKVSNLFQSQSFLSGFCTSLCRRQTDGMGLMKIYVIMKWDGNRWALEGVSFVHPGLADDYVEGKDELRVKEITLDTYCG